MHSNVEYIGKYCSSILYSGEGNGTPLQYSCLENPMDRGAWWAAVYGVAQSRTRLKRLSSSSSSSICGYLRQSWMLITFLFICFISFDSHESHGAETERTSLLLEVVRSFLQNWVSRIEFVLLPFPLHTGFQKHFSEQSPRLFRYLFRFLHT